jgi:hypothetical protein
MKNSNLHAAKKAKNDEFYTQLTDIEKELKHYKDQFKDKVVYCNCDNPQKSEFVRFFRLKFCDWGLKKLIATCITEDNSNGWGYVWDKDINGNGIMDEEEVTMIPLQQNGDFRSPECIEFLKEADIVVTNPPFSLYRSYIKQLIDYDKKFLHIGNSNAITYKEVFPYIKYGKLRTGKNWVKEFRMPDGTLKKFGNICWFTNLETHKADDPMELVEKFDPVNKHLHYDNYDAYNVDKVADIPYDTDEVLGVPITIVDRIADDGYIHFTHNEEEMKFEIVAFRKGEDGKDLVFTREREREFNHTFVSLYDVDCGDDKKRRRESEWENYIRENNNKEDIKPIDYFFPNATNRSTGSMNGMLKGKETYRRILIQKI